MWFSIGRFSFPVPTPQRPRASAIPVQLHRKPLTALTRYRSGTVDLLFAGEIILTSPEKDGSERPLPLYTLANFAGSRDSRLRRSGEAPATLSSDRGWRVRSIEPHPGVWLQRPDFYVVTR